MLYDYSNIEEFDLNTGVWFLAQSAGAIERHAPRFVSAERVFCSDFSTGSGSAYYSRGQVWKKCILLPRRFALFVSDNQSG